MLLSLLVTLGFTYQPQWMYNQPDGHSQLLYKGLPQFVTQVPDPFHIIVRLGDFFPSFVVPYFQYLRSKGQGDFWSAQAWQKSLWPLAIIALIVAICLMLAWWKERAEPTEFSGGNSQEGLPGDTGVNTGPQAPPVMATFQASRGTQTR